MKVPFLDLKKSYAELEVRLEKKVLHSLKSGRYIGGQEVEDFENNYSKACNAKYCITTGNGLDALFLGLKSLEIGPGDEVIVPAHTFIASWIAIHRTGAKIVPVDVDNSSFNIDVDLILKKLTKKTKAIMPVHMYGQPCDMEGILKLAKKYYEEKIDEIMFIDAVASLYDRNNLFNIIDQSTKEIFCPITLGGGIRSLEDIDKALKSGADKVSRTILLFNYKNSRYSDKEHQHC